MSPFMLWIYVFAISAVVLILAALLVDQREGLENESTERSIVGVEDSGGISVRDDPASSVVRASASEDNSAADGASSHS